MPCVLLPSDTDLTLVSALLQRLSSVVDTSWLTSSGLMFFSELDICCPMQCLTDHYWCSCLWPSSPRPRRQCWPPGSDPELCQSSLCFRRDPPLFLYGWDQHWSCLREGILTILVTRRFFRSRTMNFGGTFVKASLLTLLSFRRFLVWIWALHCLIRNLFLSFPSPPCFFMSWNSWQIWQSYLRHPG